MVTSVGIENIRKKRFYVAREDGEIIEKRAIKGSGLSKENAVILFRSNGTFYPGRIVHRTRLSSVNQTEYTKVGSFPDAPKDFSISKKQGVPMINAVVWAYDGRKRIGANSGFVGANSKKEREEAMEKAERNFYENVAYIHTGEYDADEGMRIVQRRGIAVNYSWFSYKRFAEA